MIEPGKIFVKLLLQAAMRRLTELTASQVAGESQLERSVHKDPVITIVPRGQPEIAIGLESQIEPWLPNEQHPARDCGIHSPSDSH